jgi:hypothetical protein
MVRAMLVSSSGDTGMIHVEKCSRVKPPGQMRMEVDERGHFRSSRQNKGLMNVPTSIEYMLVLGKH